MSSYGSPEEECFPKPTDCYCTSLSYSQSSATYFSSDNKISSHFSSGYCSSSSSHSTPNNAPTTPEPENNNVSSSTSVVVKAAKAKKTYPCTRCSKFFSRPSALETHTYTHTLEKPFQCRSPGCGRRFSVVSNLRRHFKVHQKPSGVNKITPQDRLRCVRQLIQKSREHSALSEESQGLITRADQYEPPIVCGEGLVSQQQETIPSLSLPPLRHSHYLILPPIVSQDNNTSNISANVHSKNIPPVFDYSNSIGQVNQQSINITSGQNQVDNFLFGYDLSFTWFNQVNNTGEHFTENQETNIVGTTGMSTTFTTFEDFNFLNNNHHHPY